MGKRIVVIIVFLTFSLAVFAEERLVLSSFNGHDSARAWEVVKTAYKRLGIDVEIEAVPSQRSLYLSSSGRTAGEVMRMPSVVEAYPSLVRVPVPIDHLQLVVVTKDTFFEVKGWDSLRPYRVGLRMGIEFSRARIREMDVEIVHSDESIARMINADRLDIGVFPAGIAKDLLPALGLNDLVVLQPPLENVELFHFLHTSREDLVPLVAEQLQTMINDGTMEEIRRRYSP